MRALLFALLLAAAPAHAHKPSDSYLTLFTDGHALRGQWDIALRDLEYAIGLDANGDGAITWGELKAKQAEIDAYALARLSLRADGGDCKLEPIEHLVDDHTDGAYAVLRFAARCPGESHHAVEVEYRLVLVCRRGRRTRLLFRRRPLLHDPASSAASLHLAQSRCRPDRAKTRHRRRTPARTYRHRLWRPPP